jgi:hypothetical protein
MGWQCQQAMCLQVFLSWRFQGFHVNIWGWSDTFLWLKIGFWTRLWNPQWMKILVALYVNTQLCFQPLAGCLHVDMCTRWELYCFGIVFFVSWCWKLPKSLHNLLGKDDAKWHPLQLFPVHTTLWMNLNWLDIWFFLGNSLCKK